MQDQNKDINSNNLWFPKVTTVTYAVLLPSYMLIRNYLKSLAGEKFKQV